MAAQLYHLGPTDSKIKSEMNDILKEIRHLVTALKNRNGFGRSNFKAWGNIERQNPALFKVIEVIFDAGNANNHLEALLKVQTETMNVKNEQILSSVIGFVIFAEVLEMSPFPELLGQKSFVAELYRDVIKKQCDKMTDLCLQHAVWKSLINNEAFHTWTLTPTAVRKSEHLNNILQPLLDVSKDDAVFLPDCSGGIGPLAAFQGKLLPLFKRALLLSCLLKLKVLDKHVFFWPRSGAGFNGEQMERADRSLTKAEGIKLRVHMTLFPGLIVMCADECENCQSQDGKPLHGVCRSKGGDVLTKALVSVATG